MEIDEELLKPSFSLCSSPESLTKCKQQIYIALKDHSIVTLLPNRMQIKGQWASKHLKRISCIGKDGDTLITSSYDSTVKVWDCRNHSLIHNFNRPGAQFTTLDCSENILAAGHGSKITFWDLRKMKQKCQFTQSFNGQISCLMFDKKKRTNLMACSLDGMINKFDLTQSTEEDSLEWGHRIQQCPQKLIFAQDYTVVKTTEHTILTLYQQDVIRKQEFNNPQTPKHILEFNFEIGAQIPSIEYYLWNLNERCIEAYSNLEQSRYINGVMDIQVMCSIGQMKSILWGDEKGNIFIERLGQKINSRNNSGNQMLKQEYSVKNGFIINKPSSLKNNHKKFKPY